MARTFARNLVVDMSVPISNRNSDSRQGFICPFPLADESGNSFWGIFKPFQYQVGRRISVYLFILTSVQNLSVQVWIYLFVGLFAYTLVLRYVAWAKFPIRKDGDTSYDPNKHWVEILWFLLRILLNGKKISCESFI